VRVSDASQRVFPSLLLNGSRTGQRLVDFTARRFPLVDEHSIDPDGAARRRKRKSEFAIASVLMETRNRAAPATAISEENGG
jgi:hypothetical protein